MTETKNTTSVEEDLAQMDETIRTLEAEQAQLEAFHTPLTWDEIDASMLEELEAKERRRGIVPRLLAAARIKHAELRIASYERQAEPLRAECEKAYEKVERTRARVIRAQEEEQEARAEWGAARTAVGALEQRIKSVHNEIRQLKGEE